VRDGHRLHAIVREKSRVFERLVAAMVRLGT
jgi:hypothetical protein